MAQEQQGAALNTILGRLRLRLSLGVEHQRSAVPRAVDSAMSKQIVIVQNSHEAPNDIRRTAEHFALERWQLEPDFLIYSVLVTIPTTKNNNVSHLCKQKQGGSSSDYWWVPSRSTHFVFTKTERVVQV
ncbi:hypothetical protein EJB05_39024 [Eragrostis curvula]|uniref:Uncharacterized protein n=1 Tax=Eragrostis curvula TaxID=38414 RepID=A0A5J9TVR9_9POAL|nr:hypothetical protein EJB05_39024 [Eragrostis curvula]